MAVYSRVMQYKSSMKKFINSENTISDNPYKDSILKIMNDSEFYLSIPLLTIMNGLQRKNNFKSVHGYSIATGIELLNIFISILNYKRDISDTISKYKIANIDALIFQLHSIIPLLYNETVELVSPFLSTVHENNNDLIKTISCGTKQIHEKIEKIFSTIANLEIPESKKISSKTDLKNFHFKKNYDDEDIQKINVYPKDFIIKYISDTYGNICKLILIISWILGGNSIDMINNLERLGIHFCLLYKIAYDFENLNKDMDRCISGKITFNYIINCGMQSGFDLFDESKKKFFEGIIAMGISSTTIKELVDIMTEKVTNAIEQSSPDIIKSDTSSQTIKSNN